MQDFAQAPVLLHAGTGVRKADQRAAWPRCHPSVGTARQGGSWAADLWAPGPFHHVAVGHVRTQCGSLWASVAADRRRCTAQGPALGDLGTLGQGRPKCSSSFTGPPLPHPRCLQSAIAPCPMPHIGGGSVKIPWLSPATSNSRMLLSIIRAWRVAISAGPSLHPVHLQGTRAEPRQLALRTARPPSPRPRGRPAGCARAARPPPGPPAAAALVAPGLPRQPTAVGAVARRPADSRAVLWHTGGQRAVLWHTGGQGLAVAGRARCKVPVPLAACSQRPGNPTAACAAVQRRRRALCGARCPPTSDPRARAGPHPPRPPPARPARPARGAPRRRARPGARPSGPGLRAARPAARARTSARQTAPSAPPAGCPLSRPARSSCRWAAARAPAPAPRRAGLKAATVLVWWSAGPASAERVTDCRLRSGRNGASGLLCHAAHATGGHCARLACVRLGASAGAVLQRAAPAGS